MKTRRFIVYSIVYIILVGVLVYSLEPREQTFGILGYSFTLPLAAWIVIPLIVFALLCIFHMAYYGFEIYMFKRAIKNDELLYKELAREVFLGLDTNKDFKTEFFKVASQITKILSPWGRHSDENIGDKELNDIFETITKAKNSEVVELKKFRLQDANALFLQNELNKINHLENYYMDVLKNKNSSKEAILAANKKLLELGTLAEIKKYGLERSVDDIKQIVKRFINGDLNATNDEIFEILDNKALGRADFNEIALMLKSKLAPDAIIGVFEKLRLLQSSAEEAYLYLLFEFQMLDKVRDIVENSDANEYQNIKIFMYLRENGKLVPENLLFR